MDEQETPAAGVAQEATAITTPPDVDVETSIRDKQSADTPDVPPPSHIPEQDDTQDQHEPMQIDRETPKTEQPPTDSLNDAPPAAEPDTHQTSMATPQAPSTTTPSRGGSASGRGSRSTKRVSFPIVGEDTPTTMADATPSSAPRGRPPGRPRGSRARGPTRGTTRGNRGGRGGKRKRSEDDDGGISSDSETYAPTTTKSGRNVQKPTSFVPPPQPSPPTMPSFKKKRTYRRNPESAVCKICLRGVSPASNMIVFCDGCNVPYHRYCHQPPIDQSVIDEFDKEWYCKQCERERIQPVPEAHVVGFVAAENASAEQVSGIFEIVRQRDQSLTYSKWQRQKYFSSLPPGLLVTLLTKATTLHPDLPLFDPSFQPDPASSTSLSQKPIENGHSQASIKPIPIPTTTILRNAEDSDDQYGSDEHPAHYPRPGQGLMSILPPEKEDLHYLVDDENSRGVFMHVYQEDPKKESEGASVGAEEH